MKKRAFTGNPSQVLVEQLSALGVKYIFNNTGSHEARFFDALHDHPDIHSILGLHEGVVTGMAGGYSQVKNDPAVMVAHLDCGLGQTLGQMLNIQNAKLPVVVITYAADTGSGTDRVGWGHHISHNMGPTHISAPYVKASWTVLKSEGMAHAIYRALLVAKTPPVGAVHLAIYENTLTTETIEADIVESGLPDLRAGYPADSDVEKIARSLTEAERPLLFFGDGIWKSGAEGELIAFAERFGVPLKYGEEFWNRGILANHKFYWKDDFNALDPDCVVAIGVRHRLAINQFSNANHVVAIGTDVDNLKNFEGLDQAVIADEHRTLERLTACLDSSATNTNRFEERRERLLEKTAAQQKKRIKAMKSVKPETSRVRPWVLADTLDKTLEGLGGGIISMEHFALLNCLGGMQPAGSNVYIPPAGGSEGYGMGAAIGVKLAAPSKPVVGLVGDGSVYYADTGFWTAAHHKIPVLYVIPNNQCYGIVAKNFSVLGAGGTMHKSGNYAGVVLDQIDPVKIAEGYGVEGLHVQEESKIEEAMKHGLKLVEQENRPFVLNVHLPIGLPEGGRPAKHFELGH